LFDAGEDILGGVGAQAHKLRFKVVGTNLKTSAKMVIEVEAEDSVAAERAAAMTGMEVLHLEQVSDDPFYELPATTGIVGGAPATDDDRSSATPWIILTLIVLLTSAAIVAFWPQILGLLMLYIG
jgi:hypothetical protein